jgi:hypothetical protein
MRLGDQVTFVRKRTEALMRNEQDAIYIECVNSSGQTRPSHQRVPPLAAGMAVAIALDADAKREHKRVDEMM